VTRLSLSFAVPLTVLLSAGQALATPPVADPVFLSDAPGETELSLGARAETGAARRELSGFLALSVPFERLAAPRVAAADAPPPPPVPAVPVEQPAEQVTKPPTVRPRALDATALAALARGALAAARRAEHAPERERALDGLASRARLSSLLPEVRVRAARTRDESLRLTPTTDDPYRFTLAGGDAVVLEGAATFRLSRLLFADEELAVERLRLERERNAERRVARVLERVLAWHAALVRLASAGEEGDRERLSLELDAASVELDVLTNGWFQARVATLGVLSEPAPRPAVPATADRPAVSRPLLPASRSHPPAPPSAAALGPTPPP
jgi:hypothetical protein